MDFGKRFLNKYERVMSLLISYFCERFIYRILTLKKTFLFHQMKHVKDELENRTWSLYFLAIDHLKKLLKLFEFSLTGKTLIF